MSKSDELTEKSLAQLERKLKREYRKAYEGMKARYDEYINGSDEMDGSQVIHHQSLAERLAKEEEAYKQGKYTDAEWKAYVQTQIQRGERYQAMANDLANRMTNANLVAESYINDKTPGIYSLNANYQAYEIGQGLQGVSFTMYDEQTVKNLITENGNYTEFRTVKVNPVRDYEWNTKQINSALTSAILQGKSVDKLADSFMAVMKRNRSSAIRNARTAYTSAQNGGRMTSLRQAKAQGIEVRKQWLSAHDGRVRDSHAMLNGQIRDIEDEFDNGLMYPGDSNGIPSEVYNCRCTLTYIYPEYDDDESSEIYRDEALKDETYPSFIRRMKNEKIEIKKDKKLRDEYDELLEKYGLNIPQTFKEYKKLKKSDDYPAFKGFLRAIDNNHIDALAGRELYLKTYKKAVSELNGITTSAGIEITEPSIHLTERIIGYHVGMKGERVGVDIPTIIDVLTNPKSDVSEIYERNGRFAQTYKFNKTNVTINPHTGVVIQANPESRHRDN